MPKGPKGEKRPGDVIGAAIMVARIATGEIENDADDSKARHRELRDRITCRGTPKGCQA